MISAKIKFGLNKVYTYSSKYHSQEYTLISRTEKTATFITHDSITMFSKFDRGYITVKKRIKVGFCKELNAHVEYVTPYPNKNCLLTAIDNNEPVFA